MTGFMVQINNFPFTMDVIFKVLHKKPEFGNFFALVFHSNISGKAAWTESRWSKLFS